jgi:hypothetical protein
MAGKTKTPQEIFEAILAFEHDDEVEALDKMTDEEVAAAIAKDGGDPVAMGARGKALAEALIERRKRLQWQVEAREKLDTAAAVSAAVGSRPKRTRGDMIEELKRAQNEEGFSVGLAARKGGTDAASDEELEELLKQVEMLRAVKGRPPG